MLLEERGGWITRVLALRVVPLRGASSPGRVPLILAVLPLVRWMLIVGRMLFQLMLVLVVPYEVPRGLALV